jgi:hypothetical protein
MAQKDPVLAAHRVYIADHKVDTARALAQTQAAETERKSLVEQGDKARLDARTREADLAKNDALVARAEGAEQKLIAGQARENADAAQMAANASQQQALELQRQLEILQAAAGITDSRYLRMRSRIIGRRHPVPSPADDGIAFNDHAAKRPAGIVHHSFLPEPDGFLHEF